MADFVPSITPYHYCYNNPIKLIDPDGMWPENGINDITSTYIDDDGNVLWHVDDGDPRVYLVSNPEEWVKGGRKKDGLPVVGFEDPKKDYKPGDQYTYYNPAEDPNYNGEYLIPAEAYNYYDDEIEGKFSQDWAYIIYGNDGIAVSRWAEMMWRDLTAPDNRSTVISAGIDIIPLAGLGAFKVVKGAKYAGQIGSKFHKFVKVVPAKIGKGQARAEYVQIFNSKGNLVKMYKDSYSIDGRLIHRRLLKPNEPGVYRK